MPSFNRLIELYSSIMFICHLLSSSHSVFAIMLAALDILCIAHLQQCTGDDMVIVSKMEMFMVPLLRDTDLMCAPTAAHSNKRLLYSF